MATALKYRPPDFIGIFTRHIRMALALWSKRPIFSLLNNLVESCLLWPKTAREFKVMTEGIVLFPL